MREPKVCVESGLLFYLSRMSRMAILPVFLFFALMSFSESMAQSVAPPKAARRDHQISTHGHTRQDPWYWLNQREDPEVIAYLEAENAYKDAVMAPLKAFEDQLFGEIVGRIKADDESVPYRDNGYIYSQRYSAGQEYPVYLRKKDEPGAEAVVMLDVNELAKPYSYYAVATREVSPNNKLLVYAEDTLSRRIYTLRFKNLETGETLEDKIENTAGNVVWAADNKTVFYTRKDETLRPYKVFKHVLGTPVEQDVEVFHEEDDTFYTYIYKTKSRDYVVIHSGATLTSEARFIPADQPNAAFKIFEPRNREAKLEYGIDHDGKRWYVRNNLDAVNFKLSVAEEGKTSRKDWKDLVPGRAEALVEGFELFKDFLVLSERVNGIVQQRIIPMSGNGAGSDIKDHIVDFGASAYYSGTGVNQDLDTRTVRLVFTSMTTPVSEYDYDVASGKLKLLKRQEVVGDFNPEEYVDERIQVAARDGKMIPLSIVRHKNTKVDGTAPLLLYGYGSYGNSMDPTFSSVRLSLLDRGFVYVIAHIRGGEELGRQWYEDGKLLKKRNTFTDFIDAGKALVEKGYAAKDQLYAMGGSAGGLLMGAVVNMEPDMWAGIVAAVPFVDVVTTMLDESIPLTTGEFDEWGNPKEQPYYEYMLSYSPYDQVEAKAYPHMLVTTGLHDSQVQYWEPAKWVAKLREMKTNNKQLLLHTNMETGHSGASGRFARYRETAMEYAWLLSLAGKAGKQE